MPLNAQKMNLLISLQSIHFHLKIYMISVARQAQQRMKLTKRYTRWSLIMELILHLLVMVVFQRVSVHQWMNAFVMGYQTHACLRCTQCSNIYFIDILSALAVKVIGSNSILFSGWRYYKYWCYCLLKCKIHGPIINFIPPSDYGQLISHIDMCFVLCRVTMVIHLQLSFVVMLRMKLRSWLR